MDHVYPTTKPSCHQQCHQQRHQELYILDTYQKDKSLKENYLTVEPL